MFCRGDGDEEGDEDEALLSFMAKIPQGLGDYAYPFAYPFRYPFPYTLKGGHRFIFKISPNEKSEFDRMETLNLTE